MLCSFRAAPARLLLLALLAVLSGCADSTAGRQTRAAMGAQTLIAQQPHPLATSAVPFPSPSPTPPDLAAKAGAYFSAEAQAGRFSGAVLAAQDGHIVLKQGYGMADYENDVPNTPQTRFRLGSITKQFTAMAILMLQERGKLRLEGPIGSYLPDCPEAWRAITIRQLLLHTSGLPEFLTLPDADAFQMLPATPLETIARVKDLPLLFQPGEKWSYSNTGYLILGYIVERASGQSYESFLQQNIFDPLQMAGSGYDHYTAVLKHRATGYVSPRLKAGYLDMSVPYAAGGLYSTVEDLYTWDQALYTERLVTRRSLDEMFTPQVTPAGSAQVGYGYGWFISTAPGRRVVWHGGNIQGFSALIRRYPDDRVTIVILSNLQGAPLDAYATYMEKVIFGPPS